MCSRRDQCPVQNMCVVNFMDRKREVELYLKERFMLEEEEVCFQVINKVLVSHIF